MGVNEEQGGVEGSLMSLQHCLVVRAVAWFDSFVQEFIGKPGLEIFCTTGLIYTVVF